MLLLEGPKNNEINRVEKHQREAKTNVQRRLATGTGDRRDNEIDLFRD